MSELLVLHANRLTLNFKINPFKEMSAHHIFSRYNLLEPYHTEPHIQVSLAKDKETGELVDYHNICYEKLLVHPQEPDFTAIERYMKLRHPCLLNILDVYNNKPARKVVVITERSPSHELADLITTYKSSNTPIPEEQIWAILYSVCAALSYCHSNSKHNCPKVPKLVHRYVSSFSILIGENTSMLTKLRFPDLFALLDIRSISESPTSHLVYMAPEILRREKYTDKADIWSLGCVAYELCTLSLFTKIPSSEIIRQSLDGSGKYITLPNYSQSLEALVNKMLAFNEKERISSHEVLLWPEMQTVATLVSGIPARTSSQLMATIRGNTGSADELRQSTTDLLNRLNATYGKSSITQVAKSSLSKETEEARSTYIGDPTTRPLPSSATGQEFNYAIPNITWKSALMRSGQLGNSMTASTLNSPGMIPANQGPDPIAKSFVEANATTGMTASQINAADYSAIVANAAKIGGDSIQMRDDVASQILRRQRITEPINDKLASQKYMKRTTDMEQVAPVVVNEIMSDFLTMRYGVKVDKEHLVDRIFNVVPGKIVNADKADLDPEAPEIQRDIRRHSPNDIVDLLMMKKELDDRLEPYAYRLNSSSESRARDLYKQSREKDSYEPYLTGDEKLRTIEYDSQCIPDTNSGILTDSKRKRSKSSGKTKQPRSRAKSKQKGAACCNAKIQDAEYGGGDTEIYNTYSDPRSSQVINGTISAIGNTVIARPNEEGDRMEEVRILDDEQMRAEEELRYQEMIENDIEMTIRTHNDMVANDSTPLMVAASSDNVDQVRFLLPMHGGETTTKGITALMMAASAGHVRSVKLLIPKEGKMQDRDGMTALMYAAHFGKLEAVKELVETEHNKVNSAGLTALMIAAEFGNVDIVNFLKTYESKKFSSSNETAMMRATKLGHIDVVKELLEFESKLQNKDGYTALMTAIQCNKPKIAALLAHSEAGIATSSGWTALMSCATNSNVEAARILVDHEANMRDKYDETALMKAAKSGAVNVARILLPVEACQTRYDGKTALMCAAEAGHASVVSLLLPKEGRMKRTDGTTALMCAAQSNCIDVIRLLLPSEKRMQKLDGETALIRAIRWGRPEAVRELIKDEYDLNMHDDRTVLDIAKQAGNRDITELIFSYV